MRPVRTAVRSTLLALLVAASALAPGARPAQAAPPHHTVTIMVTSIEVVDSLDPNSCGEFNRISLRANAGVNWEAVNVIPQGAPPEYWGVGDGTRTFSMCQGSTYPVAQTNLPELAATWQDWATPAGSDMFLYRPLTAANINRLTVKGQPGAAVVMDPYAWEADTANGGVTVEGGMDIAAPAAGKSRSFTLGFERFDIFFGADTALVLRGVVTTSAMPTS